MKKLSAVFILLLMMSLMGTLGSCQTKKVDKEGSLNLLEPVPAGLIKDDLGNWHLPLDFADRYPLLADSKARAKRLEWFNKSALGVYIDFGLHTHIGTEFMGRTANDPEWMLCIGQINPNKYEAEAKTFNLKGFSVDEYIKKVQMMGAEYVVLNAKHYDGFCLFDSAYTKYDLIDAPKERVRDLYLELVPALKAAGIKVGFHYSLMDWNHPAQARFNDAGVKQVVDFIPIINKNQKTEYKNYVKNQVTELITKYHADMIWFDGNWIENWSSVDGWDLQEQILSLNPKVIVNNRIGKDTPFDGDFSTFDQNQPYDLHKLTRNWELLFQIDLRYGYKMKERLLNYKTLVTKYVDAASRGGNILVKMTWDPSMKEKPGFNENQEKVNEWVKGVRTLISNADAAPPQFWPTGLGVIFNSWRRFMVKEDKLYLFSLLNIGGITISVPEIKDKIYTKAYYLSDPTSELPILNMGEVLDKRLKHHLESIYKDRKEAKKLEKMKEGQELIKKQEAPSDYFVLDKKSKKHFYYKPDWENKIFNLRSIDFDESDYENVKLSRINWPKKQKMVIIVIEMEDYSVNSLLTGDLAITEDGVDIEFNPAKIYRKAIKAHPEFFDD